MPKVRREPMQNPIGVRIGSSYLFSILAYSFAN